MTIPLSLFPKPSHYAGCEFGAVSKDKASVKARLALAFPDLYEVGMSYTGLSVLYHVVNRDPALWAERVFSPCLDTAAVLRERDEVLRTLESGTPLKELDAVGFHLTHELCYTNVLFMLDLAGIPLRTEERGLQTPLDAPGAFPLILAGGGMAFNAEPIAPYLDCLVLGDGEEILPEILHLLTRAKERGERRIDFLRALSAVPGVYVPCFFQVQPDADNGPGVLEPLFPDYTRVEKRLVADLDAVPFPERSPQAFDAVHDRFTIEIARGCTRGCRFCHAGMVYRPVRERNLDTLDALLNKGLSASGYGEVSFLALSAGDFSALSGLFSQSLDRCRAEQVSISLPSLRVGSINESIMADIAGIRRTGATLAPEAGSERLREVINKGVTEDDLLRHVRMLAENGWQSVKLYFMIGLPTETDEDIEAILDLCLKVEAAAGRNRDGRRLMVTAAISPFVPKPHTPFQWEAQLTLAQTRERIERLRSLFRPYKRLKMRWHMPEMSFLEGILARGDRRLAPVVERAYQLGALFCSWTDKLDLAPWMQALEEHGLTPDSFLAARDPNRLLPWDHLQCGVSRNYLLLERERAFARKVTPDCRYAACRTCGVCNHEGRVSELRQQNQGLAIATRLNQATRDQEPAPAPTPESAATPQEPAVMPSLESAAAPLPETPDNRQALGVKAAHYRLWYEKTGATAYLSQLELQSVFERAMRRAKLPLSFSQGFHPMPRISFTRALPVGVASQEEYLDLYLRESFSAGAVLQALTPQLPAGLRPIRVEILPLAKKQPPTMFEEYVVQLVCGPDKRAAALAAWEGFRETEHFALARETSKGTRVKDIRPLFREIEAQTPDSLRLLLDWSRDYVNPLALVRAVMPELDLADFSLTKRKQLR